MIKWLRHVMNRIDGISTPFGGISWKSEGSKTSKIPIFCDPICITSIDNSEFISFLETNNCKIIFLKTFLDASVSIKEQHEIVEKEAIDIDLIVSCEFSGVTLPLPNKDGRLITIAFYFNDDHVLNFSTGGTGIVRVDIIGFFEVSRTFHGGPTTSYHLKEGRASLETRVDLLNH